MMSLAIIFCVAATFLILVFAVISNRAIFADGSFFLLMTANTGTIFNAGNPGNLRTCAHGLTQALVVLSLRFGVRDFQTLGLIYSLNQYLVPFLSLIACVKLLRDKRYALFPILSYLFGTLQIYSMIACESHVIVALFWPIFLIILEWEYLTMAKATCLPILAGLALDCYESAMFLSSLALALLMFKVVRNGIFTKPIWILTALLLVSGVILAIKSTLAAAGGVNESGFFVSYKSLIKHDIHLYGLVILVLLAYALERFKWKERILWPLTLMVFSLTLLYFSLNPTMLKMQENYSFRIALVIFPLGLAVAAASFKILSWERFLDDPWIWRSVIFMSAYYVAVQLCCSLQWYGYQQLFKSYLLTTTNRGIVEYHDTPFVRKQDGSQLICDLNWYWTFPMMSIILSHDGQVNTLVYDKDDGLYVPFPVNKPPQFQPDFNIHYNYLESSSNTVPSK